MNVTSFQSLLRLAVILVIAVFSNQSQSEELMLVQQGRAECVIVVGTEPTPAEQTAAKELQEFLAQATGAELPIRVCTDIAKDQPQIVVGPSPRVKELLPEVQLEQIGDDGILIRTVGNALVLAGPAPRGTLYAVYTFLEDTVGCRWWTSDEATIPQKPTLTIPSLNIQYAPKLKSRTAYYRDALRSPFAARLKTNGSATQLDEAHGGNNRFAMFVHTFFPLLPPAKYFDAHPDWYSLIDGKRVHENAQLCLTNNAMRKELTQNALQVLRENPGAKLISISQNDWRNPCQCDKCQTIVAEEESESGVLLRFVNAVAEEIEREFPDVWVETLAYQYTRKAPKLVRPRTNVVVRLCSIECSFVQPLGGEKYGGNTVNEEFRADIEAWSRVAPRLFVWDYVTNFSNYLVPHPNLPALAPNVRFFVDHNVVGLFEQGDAESGVGDFVGLRAWLLAHLMWDPSRDDQQLIDEYLAGYYGAAAPHLREYLDLISSAGLKSDKYLGCFLPDTSRWLTLEQLNRATRLFAAAEQAVADDLTLSKRVRRERLPLDHVWLSRYESLKIAATLRKQEFLGPQEPRDAVEEFIRVAKANAVGSWRERHPFAERAEALRAKFGPPAAAPKEAGRVDAASWIDFQDGQFRLWSENDRSSRENDRAASDGRAASMPGDHLEWAIGLPFSEDLSLGNPWHVYVSVRVDATASDGPAMTLGIYDERSRKSVTDRSLAINQVAGENYQVIDLGSHPLHGEMYFWAAPPKRPGEVQKVWVDRVFMIRE
jgi:hypothetical protein